MTDPTVKITVHRVPVMPELARLQRRLEKRLAAERALMSPERRALLEQIDAELDRRITADLLGLDQ